MNETPSTETTVVAPVDTTARITSLEKIRDDKITAIDQEAKDQADSCRTRHREEQKLELDDISQTAKCQKDTARTNAKRAIENWKRVGKAQLRQAAKDQAVAEKAAAKEQVKKDKEQAAANKPGTEAATPPVVAPNQAPTAEAAPVA